MTDGAVTSESRDDAVSYLAVLGVLLVCSCLLVVSALAFYLCSVARLGRRAPADVTDRETTPTAVTSLSPTARRKESETGAKSGLLRSLLPNRRSSGGGGGGGGGEDVTWYGSRDVEVGRPTNVRYVSLRRIAQQSSSIESEAGAVTPSSATKRFAPKRFGFVGWTRNAAAATPGECLRHQSSGDSTAAAPTLSLGENGVSKLPVGDASTGRYVAVHVILALVSKSMRKSGFI